MRDELTTPSGGQAQSAELAAPVVELDGVWLSRPSVHMVRDVTWRINDGERWVVLGPNGAGKSSLLRLVGGVRLPSRGRATLLGERVGRVDLRELRTRIGFVAAGLSRRLRPELTAEQVVWTGEPATLGAFTQPKRPQLDRARALLEQFGCGALRDRRFSSLSDGERQRVLLARGLMPEPEILLLDEPVTSLDIGARERFIAELGRLRADHLRAVVMVTHRVEDIPAGFTHALLLRDGRLLESDTLARALTSETLSACFGVPLLLHEQSRRYHAVAAG